MGNDSAFGGAMYMIAFSLYIISIAEIYRLKRRIKKVENSATFEGGKISTQLQSLKGTYCWLAIYNDNNEFSSTKKYYCYIIDCDETFVHVTWQQHNYTNRSMIRINDISRIDLSPQ